MTKPAVWVQFIIKKNNGVENKLLHLKYPTCRKLWLFLFCNYKDLRSQIVLSYPYPQLRLICGSFEFRSNYGKCMEVDLDGSQSEKWERESILAHRSRFLCNRGRPENIL